MRHSVRGACPLDCPDTCAWLVTVEDGRAVSMRGDRAHPFTRGALCGKVDHYLDSLYSPDRLMFPLRRIGAKGEGRFQRIGWDDAISQVAEGIRRAIDENGPEAVLPYYFAGTMGIVQGWTLGQRLFAALGASRLRPTICTAATHAALRSTLGGAVGFDPEDLASAGLIILWGENVLSTNLHQWRFVLDARRNGAYVVAIDPLRTPTAERCNQHVAPLPGTDAALALGLMRAVLDAGAEDSHWLEQYTVGWPALRRRLEEWPVQRAAEVCSVPTNVLYDLGHRLAMTRPTAIRLGLGLQRHAGAGAAIRAISAIPAVTGDWRYVGGGILSMTSGHSVIDDGAIASPPDLPMPTARSINMSRLAEALTEVDDPPVSALVVFDANPAATAPDQCRVRAGMMREDLFTVVLEQRHTDTTLYADVVLPATMQPEHLDVHVAYGHNYVALNEPAVEAPGECLPNSEIFRRMARALGLNHPRLRDSDVDVARQLLEAPAAHAAGISLEALRERGWMRAANFERGTAPFAVGGFPTTSGKVEFLSRRLGEAGLDPLVGYSPPREVGDQALARRFPLVLLAPASRFFINSTFADEAWHLAKMGPPRLFLHPKDAAAREIETGDAVRIWNDRGDFFAEAVLTDATRPGVTFTLKAYWPRRSIGNRNVNATTPVHDTDLGGGPTFHDNRVEVESV